MQEQELLPLIRKFLAGECTPEEEATLLAWYESFENEEDLLSLLSSGELAALREEMLRQIMQRLRWEGALPQREPVLWKKVYLWAGGAAAAALLFWGVHFFLQTDHDAQVPVARRAVGKLSFQKEEVLVENSQKSILRRTLPDGSIIWMQRDTRLHYPSHFCDSKREVWLSGEAFFEVNPEPSRPFIVYSGDLVTRVLGTSFNIRAYDSVASAEVSVFSGKVSVRRMGGTESEEGEILLAKDEKVVFLPAERLFEKQTFSVRKQPGLKIWEKNSISFDNDEVSEVIRALNAEFNVRMRVHQEDLELNGYRLKADFTNQNLPDILEMLAKSLDLHYEMEGDEIILKLDRDH